VPAEVLERSGLRGSRVLARASTDEGSWLLGTRDELVIVEPLETLRVPWERVEAADWDRDLERLRVSEVGEFGRPRPVHVFTVPDPGLLLQLVRERVTASVLLQRRVVVSGRSGLLVIARRPPRGRGAITWAYELDAGVDPDDPAVQQAAAAGLRAAQDELGGEEQPI
jgi:hypothetical protein